MRIKGGISRQELQVGGSKVPSTKCEKVGRCPMAQGFKSSGKSLGLPVKGNGKF